MKHSIKEKIKIFDLLPGSGKNKMPMVCPIPGHDDKNPSFSIFDNGKRARCHSRRGIFIPTRWAKSYSIVDHDLHTGALNKKLALAETLQAFAAYGDMEARRFNKLPNATY